MNHLFLENMASFEALKPELPTTKSQFFAKDDHRHHFPATRDKDDKNLWDILTSDVDPLVG